MMRKDKQPTDLNHNLQDILFLFNKYEEKFLETLSEYDFTQADLLSLEACMAGGEFRGKRAQEKIPIEEAKVFLWIHFEHIRSVEEWAEKMNYSVSYFWRAVERCFEKAPIKIYINMKKSILISYLKRNRYVTNGKAVRRIHLRDGNGLNQFAKKHLNCTPTELRKDIHANRV